MAISGSGEAFPFDRLLLATGSEPVTLAAPGFDRPTVHTLRSLADARRIIAQAQSGARAVVIGSSFIGPDAAADLRARGDEDRKSYGVGKGAVVSLGCGVTGSCQKQ